MAHQNPGDDRLRELLTRAKVIAMVGASSDPARPSFRIMRQLMDAGFTVIPVNPTERTVHGERAYPSLLDVPLKVDIVDVFRRAEVTPAVARQAVAIGAPVLWLQQGISNEEAAKIGNDHGMSVIMDRCIGSALRALAIPPRAP